MQPIMTQSRPNAHAQLDNACASPDASARQRADRLAMATPAQMEAALGLLSMLDPEAFGIAFTAVPPVPHDNGDEPVPVCRHCGCLAGIFPDRGLRWLHVRSDATTAGTQQVYDPGHAPEVTWILPDEDPDNL